MNRIETKIVILVTNRLAEAKDSEAKTEMIEELSENLYQRYLELTAGDMPEEEALLEAMESLGDVEELLAYLREAEAEEEAVRQQKEKGEEHRWSFNGKGKSSFSMDHLGSEIEEIVNAAVSTAMGAVDSAKDVAKDVAHQIKERYPDGVFMQFSASRGKTVDATNIMSENVRSLEIRLNSGDVTIDFAQEEDALIAISGDTDEIETMLKGDVLSISQGNTASAAYFFMRGMRSSDIAITLPRKKWDGIHIVTVNGDVQIEEGLECASLHVTTSNGDVEAVAVCGEKMVFTSESGDIEGQNLTGDLRAETKSGDVDMGGTFGQCELFSASGDICFLGTGRELHGSSTSGEVELTLEKLPQKVKAGSISGSCQVHVPEGEGFAVSYRTVSGTFRTNLPFSGMLGDTKGDAVYGEDNGNLIHLTSVSGDIEILV